MRKKEKGYLLSESIIAITIVATVITTIYSIIMNYYVKKDNEITKYNTIQGLYTNRDMNKYLDVYLADFKNQLNQKEYVDVTSFLDDPIFAKMDIKKIYFSNYRLDSLLYNDDIPNSVKRQLKDVLEDENSNNCKYRYVILFYNNSDNKSSNQYTFVDNSYSIVPTGCYE